MSVIRSVFTHVLIAIAPISAIPALAADATIAIHTDQVMKRPAGALRAGVCLEDVNHEVYGGIYSQMILGESFQEPAYASGPKNFRAFGGSWRVSDGVLSIDGTDGPKCVSDAAPFSDGTVAVQMKFDDRNGENAGLILRVSHPRMGADSFTGYEISVDPARQVVRVARHRDNYHLLKDAPAEIPVGEPFLQRSRARGRVVYRSVLQP